MGALREFASVKRTEVDRLYQRWYRQERSTESTCRQLDVQIKVLDGVREANASGVFGYLRRMSKDHQALEECIAHAVHTRSLVDGTYLHAIVDEDTVKVR